MTKPVSYALIGCGNRGRLYAQEFRESLGSGVNLVAVADPDTAGVKQFLEQGKFTTRVYATAQELAAQERNLDGIIIAAPDHLHLESFRAVAHLNVPLLIEKPLEGNEANFRELARELMSYAPPVLIGHCMRHAPILKKARELLDQGCIGTVTSMRFVQNCHYGDIFFRGWHRMKKNITSLFLEKASHDFDIINMMNGESPATAVIALSKMKKFGGDMPNDLTCNTCPQQLECSESILNQQITIRGTPLDQSGSFTKCVYAKEADIGDDEMCMVEFANGVQVSYIQTFYTPHNYRGRIYTIIGRDGVMEVDMGHERGQISLHSRYGTIKDKTVFHFDYLGRNHYNGDTYLLRNFLNVMQGKAQPFTTVQGAIHAELIGLAAARSVTSRKFEPVEQVASFQDFATPASGRSK